MNALDALQELKAFGVRVFMTGADENGEPRHRKRRGSGDWVPGTRQANTLLAASAAMSFIDVDTGLLPDGTPKCAGAQESLDYLLELGLDDVWLYKAVSPSGGLHYGLPGFKLGEITGLLPGVDVKSLQRDLAPEDQQAFVWGPGTTRPHGRKVGGTYEVLELRLGDAEWQRPAFEAFMWELKTIADAKRTPEPTPAAGGTPQGPEGFKYALDGPPVREDQRRFLLGYALLLRDRGNDHDMRVEMLAIMQRRRVPNTNPADPWTMDHFNNIATMGAKVAAPLSVPDAIVSGPTVDHNGVHIVSAAWNCGAPPSDPHTVVDAWLTLTGFKLKYWHGYFYRYSTGRYKPMEDGEIERILRQDLRHAYYDRLNMVTGRMERVPFTPNRNKVADVIAALKADGRVYRQNHWSIDPAVVFRNGVLDLGTGVLSPYSPASFTLHKIEADYDVEALCPTWEAFIASSLPEQDQREVLQEIVGYLLSGRTDLHKIFGMWGLPRSGKSTIARTLQAIMGKRSVTSTSYNALIGSFGLASHSESSVIIVNEARTTRENKAAIDLFKAISGEDSVDVNVKNKAAYSARLPARLVMVANELPNAMDESDAFAGRFIHLMFNVSFAGRENRNLEDDLLHELPGIVAWAFRGLDRLYSNDGKFTVSDAHTQAFRRLAVSSSPVATWFVERLVVTGSEDDYLGTASMFDDYQRWCADNDVEENHVGSVERFGKYLTDRLGTRSRNLRQHGFQYKGRTGVRFAP